MHLGKTCLMLALVCGIIGVPRDGAALLTSAEIKCGTAIGKAGLARVRGRVKLEQRCRTRELAVRYNGETKDLLYKIYVRYLPLRQAN